MGYLPKHIKVRRHKWNMRIIANAVLAGAVIVRSSDAWVTTKAPARWKRQFCVHYTDGKQSHNVDSRGEAASMYLMWWFDKNDIWPLRRRTA